MLPHLIDPDPADPLDDEGEDLIERWRDELRRRGGPHYGDRFASLVSEHLDGEGDERWVTLAGVPIQTGWFASLDEALDWVAWRHSGRSCWTDSPVAVATLAQWVLGEHEGEEDQRGAFGRWVAEFCESPEKWVCEYLLAETE